jgi:hypothetical protein
MIRQHLFLVVLGIFFLLFLLGGYIWQALDEEEFPDVPKWARPKWMARLLKKEKQRKMKG